MLCLTRDLGDDLVVGYNTVKVMHESLYSVYLFIYCFCYLIVLYPCMAIGRFSKMFLPSCDFSKGLKS